MKILIVNRFFGGAQIPTGRMAEDVGRLLTESGHEVCALASSGTYAGAEKQAQHGAGSREQGVRVGASAAETLKNRTTATPNHRSALRVETVAIPKWMPRALAWLWFTWQARRRIPRMDWDVCVLMTDPPLLPLLVPRAKAAEGLRDHGTIGPQDSKRRVAVWLMDLYPEALAASGRMSATNPIYRWYLEKRQRALAAADLLIFLGETQKARGQGTGVRGQKTDGERHTVYSIRQTKTAVIPPWDDRGNIAQATEESLRNLALYAGNLGEAHCFEEILAAASFLPADWMVRFAVRGAKLAVLTAAARRTTGPWDDRATGREAKRPGAEVEITGYASEEETPQLLASARVHLITMSPGWEGVVVPSKLYGCIRTGRPVLFIGPENADTAREILRNDWGAVLSPGASGEKVAAAILELAARATREVRLKRGAEEVAELIAELGR